MYLIFYSLAPLGSFSFLYTFGASFNSISRLHIAVNLWRQEVLHLAEVLDLVLDNQRLTLRHLQLRVRRQAGHFRELGQVSEGILAMGGFLKLYAVITLFMGAIWIGDPDRSLPYLVALYGEEGLVGLRLDSHLLCDSLEIAANACKLFGAYYYQGLHCDLGDVELRLGQGEQRKVEVKGVAGGWVQGLEAQLRVVGLEDDLRVRVCHPHDADQGGHADAKAALLIAAVGCEAVTFQGQRKQRHIPRIQGAYRDTKR